MMELVRHFATERQITLVCPEFEHQSKEIDMVRNHAASMGVDLALVKARSGRGTPRFTLGRLLSPQPGVSFNIGHQSACGTVARVLASNPDARRLLIGPFASAMLQSAADLHRSHLCLIDVSEHIVQLDHQSLLRRLDGKFERLKVRALERDIVRRAGAVGAISRSDASVMAKSTGRFDIAWLPPLIPARPVEREATEPGTVLLTTNYTYHHSRHAARWFLEEVWPSMPEGYRLWVTGKDTSTGELNALCESGRAVTYHGLVSLAELDSLYGRCSIAVNPTLSGSGVQMKLMDALCRSVPVVTSSSSNPFGNLLRTATSPEEWTAAIVAECEVPAPFDYKSYFADASKRWTRWLDVLN